MSMRERLSERALRVLAFAEAEAIRLNHELIGTEHVLLGLIKEKTGIAVKVLAKSRVSLRKIRREIKKIVQSGPTPVTGSLQSTPRTRKVFEYADEESQARGSPSIDTEDILLGLLREQEGVGAQVLMNLGLRLEDMRDEVIAALVPPLVKMKILLGHPDLSDDALVERFEFLVQNLKILHGCLIGP